MSTARTLDRIAGTLGISREDLLRTTPNPIPSHWLEVDGTPDRFEAWADQVIDPLARQRLIKIAAILKKEDAPTDR